MLQLFGFSLLIIQLPQFFLSSIFSFFFNLFIIFDLLSPKKLVNPTTTICTHHHLPLLTLWAVTLENIELIDSEPKNEYMNEWLSDGRYDWKGWIGSFRFLILIENERMWIFSSRNWFFHLFAFNIQIVSEALFLNSFFPNSFREQLSVNLQSMSSWEKVSTVTNRVSK